MKTELQEAMTSGVLVEFRDAAGKTLAHAVFTDWRGRPVPIIGDAVTSDAIASAQPTASGSNTARLKGCVIDRQFELQQEADGSPSVWVRLIVETGRIPVRPKPTRRAIEFSQN